MNNIILLYIMNNSMDNNTLNKIYNSYIIITEMLTDRGFKIKNTLDLITFNKEIETNINEVYYKNKDECIYFLILKENKIQKKDIIEYIDNIYKNNKINKYSIIFLLFDKQISVYKNEISEKYNIDIEIFLINSLQMNISRHELQPEFILLNENEKNELLEKYRKENLPQIKIYDPMNMYYNGKVDDIYKIIRNNMVDRNRTSGQGIYYRIVVK
jgi:DNA-directed RNA polymerase subunit H (RpoH/RPB5)